MVVAVEEYWNYFDEERSNLLEIMRLLINTGAVQTEEEWEETLDFLRFLLEDTAAWQDAFTAGPVAPPSPLEVLAMPAWKGRERWIG